MGGYQTSQLTLIIAIAALLCCSRPAEGQFNNIISALFGGSSPPATNTVISTTTPSTTPTATPSATPSATTDATPTATPDATPAATTAADAATDTTTTTPTATPAAKTTATPDVAAAAPDAAASPDAAPAVLVPVKTPAPTVKASPSPPPPVPIVVNPSLLVPALPADQSQPLNSSTTSNSTPGPNSDQTAVDINLQISGPGVTPFVIPQQTVLLRAMASVLTTVSLGDLRIRYVTSSANSRRMLLANELDFKGRRHLLANESSAATQAAAQGQLFNSATVTLEANCSSSNAVPATLVEMQSVVNNNLLSSAFQTYGEQQWGATLLSLTAVNPNLALNTQNPCKKKLGSLCLDGSSLSVSAVEVLIALGAVVVISLLVIPCVLLEWRRKSGQMAELDPTPDTPKTPLERMQQMYNKLINTVKTASPMHRRGSSNGRSAFQESPTTSKAEKSQRKVELTATS